MPGRRSSVAERGCHLQVILLFCVFLSLKEAVHGTGEETCICSTVTNFTSFQEDPVTEACCLNFTGLAIELLEWRLLNGVAGLREIDLSNCGISHMENDDSVPRTLKALHLNDNLLKKLPAEFLKDAPSLKTLHLENNVLTELPKSFLEASNEIQDVFLDFNDLASIPSGVFKPSLVRLGFSNNSLECTCSLYTSIEKYLSDNTSNDVLVDLTCNSPKNLYGVNVHQVKKSVLCKSHRLTALFICLPLLLLLGITCCCFCSREKKGSFHVSRQQCHLATVERNGCKNLIDNHQYMQCDMSVPSEKETNELVRNQMLMKPSAALLGSNRDLYEEVEIKVGNSADPLVASDGTLYKEMPDVKIVAAEDEEREKEEEEEEEVAAGSEADAETVSVTEVLKSSTDREKLYMNQSTDYYNLVPAIELDDSDHFEYESIDLQ